MDDAKETTRLTKLQKDTHQIKGQMHKNIRSITSRGDALDTLGGKADAISSEAGTFKKGAKQVKQKKRWQYYKWRICLAICIPCTIILLLLVAAGVAALVILKPWERLGGLGGGTSSSSSDPFGGGE